MNAIMILFLQSLASLSRQRTVPGRFAGESDRPYCQRNLIILSSPRSCDTGKQTGLPIPRAIPGCARPDRQPAAPSVTLTEDRDGYQSLEDGLKVLLQPHPAVGVPVQRGTGRGIIEGDSHPQVNARTHEDGLPYGRSTCK
jgi:hypothetical protein